MNLSKSDYLKYRTCPSYFWLCRNEPELVPADTDDEVLKRRFEQGDEVELVARELFPDGVLVKSFGEQGQIETEQLITNGITTIFQATVLTKDGLYARADVFVKDGDGWKLFEIKSTCKIDRKKHIPDAAFQYLAFVNAGYSITGISIIHLNKEFRRYGEYHNPHQLFNVEDVTEEVKALLPQVQADISNAFQLLKNDARPTTCSCRFLSRAQQCPGFKLFNPDVPEYSIYNIARLQGRKLIELVEAGVLEVTDVPDDFELSDNQRFQVEVARKGIKSIDRQSIKNELDSMLFPLYFLDYESVNPAMPFIDGGAPYQQIVFQHSIHILEDPQSDHMHVEYLSQDGSIDELRNLVQSMRECIGDAGTIIVWNKSFECSRNKEIAAMLPEFSEFMLGINDRVYDLMDIFRNNYYIDPAFRGSNSIKDVLPVLAPDLSYKELNIGKGDIASLRWFECAILKSREDTDQIFTDLLKYCELDTLAMVRIYQALTEVCATERLQQELLTQ